ncbi:MAG: hypothetical protein GY847_14825 [Proteobacteria bacterium]|nr:hypothetical protein [Pseudomonadota bacterium]
MERDVRYSVITCLVISLSALGCQTVDEADENLNGTRTAENDEEVKNE